MEQKNKWFGLELEQDAGYFYFILFFVSLSWSITIGQIRAMGVFIPVWMGYYGVTLTAASFVFVLVTVGSCFNSIVAPFILSLLGSRKMMMLAAVGSTLSWIAASQLQSLMLVQVALGLVSSFFFNMHFYTSNIVFQGWMNDKRIFGNGVVFCGVPLGGLILSPFWTFLFDKFTWRGACIVQAGMAAQNLWISLLIIECPSMPIDTNRKPIDWELFKSGAMIMFSLSQFLYFGAYSSILLIVPFMATRGFSGFDAALAVTVQTVSEIIFRPILSIALNKYQKHNLNLMALAAILLSASLVITILGNSYTSFIIILVIQGAAIAFCGGLPTSIICELAGYNRLPTAFVFFAFTMDASFMVGPLVYSNLSDHFFPELIYIAGSILAAVSAGVVLATKCFIKSEQESLVESK